MTPAITRSADHQYTYEGVTYPGVSGIVDIVGASFYAASTWGAKQAADTAIRLLPDLPNLLETLGPEGVKATLVLRDNWGKDPTGSEAGTLIHGYAEKIAQGLDTGWIEPHVLERVEHYRTWLAASGWKVRLAEAMIVNPSIGYGGTFDVLAYDRDGRTVLADIKTGNIYAKAILQLAGYGLGTFVQPAGAERVYPMPDIDRYAVLHVTAKGVREVEIPIGNADRSAFIAAYELSSWVKSVKGRL